MIGCYIDHDRAASRRNRAEPRTGRSNLEGKSYMKTVLWIAILAGLVGSPALARPLGSQYQLGGYGYWDSHYGGGAAGNAGMPLGNGTATSPGGIIGGGFGAH